MVGKKEVSYEDGMNVISVIINAISEMVNMPRGTVKFLMACFVVLLVAASIYGVSAFRGWSTSYYETDEYRKAIDELKYSVFKGAEDVSNIDLLQEIILPENDELIARDIEVFPEDYPEGYDPDDPVGIGEVDPYAAMEPDIDEIRKQEAMDAWEEYNQPEPDISDRVLKP